LIVGEGKGEEEEDEEGEFHHAICIENTTTLNAHPYSVDEVDEQAR
jgi:hypothetical protein